MKVSPKKVKMLREERGWSQEHLAEISGLSYRTIQRIEKEGHCSLESKMAVASAFLVSPIELADEYNEEIGSGRIQWGAISGVVLCILLVFMALVFGGGVSMVVDAQSLIIAILLPISLSMISHGYHLTWQALKLIAWLFYEPKKSQKIHLSLPVLRKLITYAYSAGIAGALLAVLSSVNFFHEMDKFQFVSSIQVALLPIIYSVLLAELLLRPMHHKICRLLLEKANS